MHLAALKDVLLSSTWTQTPRFKKRNMHLNVIGSKKEALKKFTQSMPSGKRRKTKLNHEILYLI